MLKGGAVCLLIVRIMNQEISRSIKRETDYFSIFKFCVILKVENERGNKCI